MIETQYKLTPKRIYYIKGVGGMWWASFRPINAKTGHPWQAFRELTDGWDCWRGSNWHSRAESDVIPGNPPADWSSTWTGIRRGYSSRELACAAVDRHINR